MWCVDYDEALLKAEERRTGFNIVSQNCKNDRSLAHKATDTPMKTSKKRFYADTQLEFDYQREESARMPH